MAGQWIRVGADRGRFAALGVGNKAVLLGSLGRRVPAAVVVLHEAWEAALAEGLVAESIDGRVTVSHASALSAFLALPDLGPRVAVRSAFSFEDTSATSRAGFFVSRLGVDAGSAAAGWIPTWGLVSGVVVEIGGDLSHGSIILRELAIPAITNANGATAVFRTGDGVHLRVAQGVAERIDLSA